MTWSEHAGALRADFDRDGFVQLRAFLSPEELSELLDHLGRFCAYALPGLPREDVFYEQRGDASTLKQIQRLHLHDEYFARWMTQSKFRRVAEWLLDDEVTCQNMQYFNKPPSVGQPTPPHQDGYYFMIKPCAAVTMWLALEDVDETTGCVRYVPGSHLLGLRAHGRTETLGFSQGILDYPCPHDRAHERAFPAMAGDLLVHHALTIHRADGNSSSTRTRRALGLIYYAAAAQLDAKAHAEYQRRLSEEMIAAGKL